MKRTLRVWALVVGTVVPGAISSAQSLEGVWRSQGYGMVIEINGPALQSYEVTATTCVPGLSARMDSETSADRDATFRSPDGGVYYVRAGGKSDHKRLHIEGSASDIRIDRLPDLPAVCLRPTPNTPPANFEVFTRTWAENYISFELKHADWAKIVEENRAKITAQTTPAELFGILEGMIKPFGDAHTRISAPALKRDFGGIRPGTDRVLKGGMGEFHAHGMKALMAVTEKAYLRGPLRDFCNGQIQYGHIDEGTGYLRIVSFSGYSTQGGFSAGLVNLEKALDEIFSDAALKALVIDVRINFGGDDPYGLAIATRLASADYLAYTKFARSSPGAASPWTPGDASVVRPSTRPGFRGPVVELTGPLTISAGETFTQALLGRTPHVTRLGESTQGVFSDVLGRRMPNGWRFGLPNEVYRTKESKTFDGPGIPPDELIPVFADDDVAAGKDPCMARAMEILKQSR